VGSTFRNDLAKNRVNRDTGTSEGMRKAAGRPVSLVVGIRPPVSNSPRKQALTKMRTLFLQSQGKM
jgi:hypothetical protein